MGSVSVSSSRCCIFVSSVHHVAVLNAELCMTFRLLMLVEDARGILQSRCYGCLICSNDCLLLFSPSNCSECFYHFEWLVLRCRKYE